MTSIIINALVINCKINNSESESIVLILTHESCTILMSTNMYSRMYFSDAHLLIDDITMLIIL